ncbi:hypothetical protein [Brevundimonas sp. UBA2416]|uniref:hypothetical protein n=1 Tax=Brevundimonas sp. UBA2416 TaxID=1946124 RepID=UPI0025C3026A|nr:hypothetical protein [Brevundimonas sp. UBA2416]
MPPALHVYAGCYAGESAASAEVMAADGGVAVRFGRGSLGRLELAASAPDVFRRGSMIARFHRNADGDVTGFSYSDPLLRGMRFTRRD